MKIRSMTIFLLLSVISFTGSFAQTKDIKEKAIKEIIQESYIGGVFNDADTKAMKKGFHESFTLQNLHESQFTVSTLQKWMEELDDWKRERPDWDNRTTAEITVIGIEENAAVAQVEVYNENLLEYTDFLSLYKFSDGWKITNKIFSRYTFPYEAQSKRIEAGEKRTNTERQPPEEVMDAIGVKPGMVIGEIGAGRGRYTVHLARRVGNEGKIFANDIDEEALSYLRERCRYHNIRNIEIILGEEEDPLFHKQSLDMAIMVWVYHMLEKPVPILKNLKPSLKSGATLVILDPPDYEIDEEMKQMGRKLDPPTLRERIEKDAKETGYELIRVLNFLPKDGIYILRVKNDR